MISIAYLQSFVISYNNGSSRPSYCLASDELVSCCSKVFASCSDVSWTHGPSLFAFSSKQLSMRAIYTRDPGRLLAHASAQALRSVSNGGALRSVRTYIV